MAPMAPMTPMTPMAPMAASSTAPPPLGADCTNLTLFNNMVVGKTNNPNDKCSRQLNFAQCRGQMLGAGVNNNSVNCFDAENKSISNFQVQTLDDSITNVWLRLNNLTRIPRFTANGLVNFWVDNNPISSFKDVFVPPSVQMLHLSFTQIDKSENETLPENLTILELSACSKLKRIRGIRFPKLLYINLLESPVEEFEIAASDVPVFASDHMDLEALVPTTTRCQNQNARQQKIKLSYFCVLPDEEWNALYASRPTTAPAPPVTQARDSSSSVTIGIVVAVVVVALGAAGFLYRRKKKMKTKHNNSTGGTVEAGGSESRTISSPSRQHDDVWSDRVFANTRIPAEDIHQEALLGKGAFGEVYKGTCHGDVVAIKKLKPEFRRHDKYLQSLVKEAKLMASLEHPNIVTYIGIAGKNLSSLMVVFEFMDGGDLRSMLVKYKAMGKPTGFNREKLKIAFDITNALAYLHSLDVKVLHRDLKSHNVLLNKQMQAKLTDFGISREQSDLMTAGIGTSHWMAPEVMQGCRYDEKSDIFSFGVVLSELDTMELSYTNLHGRKLDGPALLERILRGAISVEFTEKKLVEVVEMAKECVALDPESRPSAAEVLYRLQQVIKTLK